MQSDWSGLAGNPVKFFLSQITIVFDGMFITQHYVLYPGREEDGEQTPLIDEEVGGAMKGGGATKVGGATR